MGDVLSERTAKTIKRLAAAHGGHNVRLSADRPLVLVDMDQGRSLFDLVALTEELSEALGAEVNVLIEGSLSPYLRDAVLSEAEPL
jgi:hypothetical protein